MCLGAPRFPRLDLASPGYAAGSGARSSLALKTSYKPNASAPINATADLSFLQNDPAPACNTRSHDAGTSVTAAKKTKATKPHVTVQHDYHDHAQDSPSAYRTDLPARGGVTTPFPIKLFRMLAAIDGTTERDGCESEDCPARAEGDFSGIISWQPHGRCFVVHKPKEFTNDVLPTFMGLNKLASFQRQLNLYGFQRLTRGRDRGGYYHELFLRGKFYLAHAIGRSKVKGTGVRGRSNPDQEPDLWSMSWVNTKEGELTSDESEDASVEESSDESEHTGAIVKAEPETSFEAPRSSHRSIISRSSSSSVQSDGTTAGSSMGSASTFAPPAPAARVPSHPPQDIFFTIEEDEVFMPEAPTSANAFPEDHLEEDAADNDSLSCCLIFDDNDEQAILQYFLETDDEESTTPAVQFGKTFFDTDNSLRMEDDDEMAGLAPSSQDWSIAFERIQHW